MHRGNFPIGVVKYNNSYHASCRNSLDNKCEYIGAYKTPEDAFYLGYKPYKENMIKQVAEKEYRKGNITKKCYEAMMDYEVEITD